MDEQKEASAADYVQELIERIVDPDGRLPAPLWHDGTLYITDGAILIEIEEHPKPDNAWQVVGGKFQPAGSGLDSLPSRKIKPEAIAKIMEMVKACDCPVTAVEGPPDEVDRLWQTVEECYECSGRGWATCSMGHQHDCDDCDGEGDVTTEHPSAREPVDVDGVRVARRYIWIVSQLPEVMAGKVVIPDGWNALGFKFQGGRGIVMGLKKA